jgi:hypothetical protein
MNLVTVLVPRILEHLRSQIMARYPEVRNMDTQYARRGGIIPLAPAMTKNLPEAALSESRPPQFSTDSS